MGSWNETCAISHIGIAPGDKCKTILVMESARYDNENLHARRYHQFFGIPFDTVYDDYGQFLIDPEDKDFQINLRYLKKSLIEMPQGENPYHDIPVTLELMDHKYIWNALHKERLYIKPTHKDAESKVEAFHIREDVWNHIFNDYYFETYSLKEGKIFYYDMYFEQYKEKAYHKYDTGYEKLNSLLDQKLNEGVITNKEYEHSKIFQMFILFGELDSMLFEPYGFTCPASARMVLQELFQEDKDNIHKHIESFLKVGWVHVYISRLHRNITLPGYSGQSVETKAIKRHAELILEICGKIEAEYANENYD